jgi:hypothetical protein
MQYDTHDEEVSIIPRKDVFVLADGTFVVRWSENRIQELETGQYRNYAVNDFGAVITDYELNQLKAAGLVDYYDTEIVKLRPLPDRYNMDWLTAWEKKRTRSYYLHTTLPGSMLRDVEDLLDDLGLSTSFQARVRDDFVVLWSSKGMSFQKFDDAEKARHLLVTRAPEAFTNTVVAFVETTRRN